MFMHTCAWNTIIIHILKLTTPVAKFFWLWLLILWLVLTFPASSSSFVLLTCLQRQTRCAHYDCNLQTDWNLAISLKHCSHDWETNKTSHQQNTILYLVQCQVHRNLRSLATMDLHQARCADKLSPVSIIVPSELLIRTIAATNMALWTFGRPGQLWQTPGRQHVEMNILGEIAMFT